MWWRYLGTVSSGRNEEVDWFELNVRRKVGDGCSTSFWEGNWLLEGPNLKLKFNRLFDISSQQLSSKNDKGAWEEGAWKWKLTWRRNLFVWEKELLELLHPDLDSLNLKQGLRDSWYWKAEPIGSFSVKSAYEVQRGAVVTEDGTIFKLLWTTLAPSNSLVFSWKVFLNRIQSIANLKRRNIIQQGPQCVCIFC